MNPAQITAFDYDKQQWLDGEPARLLRLKQLRKELETLSGPRGQKFFDQTKQNHRGLRTIGESIRACELQIAELEALAPCTPARIANQEQQTKPTLYGELVAAGVEIANHESDLYVPDTAQVREILARYPISKANARPFRNQITKTVWLDIPFAFLPWWEARQNRNTGRAA
jgi:hypothetical protein